MISRINMSMFRDPSDVLNEEVPLDNMSGDSENDESAPCELNTCSGGYQMPISKQRANMLYNMAGS